MNEQTNKTIPLIFESGENYLEAILLLEREQGAVRAVDVAQHLGFSKPSVSRAIKVLVQKELVVVVDNHITLTQKGRAHAETVLERHEFFIHFLQSIGVPSEIAKEDACSLEHALSDVSYEAIKAFFQK